MWYFYAVVMWIIVAHFVCDFILQSDQMAVNKSHNWYWLFMHVAAYSSALAIFTIPLFGLNVTLVSFVLINGLLHFVTDAITSRISSFFWQKEQRHWFFVTIGADQVIHYACLFGTFAWLTSTQVSV